MFDIETIHYSSISRTEQSETLICIIAKLVANTFSALHTIILVVVVFVIALQPFTEASFFALPFRRRRTWLPLFDLFFAIVVVVSLAVDSVDSDLASVPINSQRTYSHSETHIGLLTDCTLMLFKKTNLRIICLESFIKLSNCFFRLHSESARPGILRGGQLLRNGLRFCLFPWESPDLPVLIFLVLVEHCGEAGQQPTNCQKPNYTELECVRVDMYV